MIGKRGWLIVGVGVFLFFAFITWLLSIYEPPFPPQWIGVKYYLFDVNSLVEDKSLDTRDLAVLSQKLETIQTALLVFEPSTPIAKQLLPPQMVVHTYTLSDSEVVSLMIENALARELSGIDFTEREGASELLSNPLDNLHVKQVLLAVTQSNNFGAVQELFIESLNSKGKEISHSEYERIQSRLQLAPELDPSEVTDNLLEDADAVNISKRGVYRIYENEIAKTATVGATMKRQYDSFVSVNDFLVPTKGGRSPWVILDPGTYNFQSGASAVPITFYHAIHTVNGLPFIFNGVGHGWTTIAFEENDVFYPLMTASLFPSLDYDNKPNLDAGEFTNIATYTNLWVNHPDDWDRSTRSLNRLPLPDGPTRIRLNIISPEEAREILFLRAWYLSRYSTQEIYMEYLQKSLLSVTDYKSKLALLIEIGHIRLQNMLSDTFFGALSLIVNEDEGDNRYNGVTANCVGYSAAFWNSRNRDPDYNPRMLFMIPVPGKLYNVMSPGDVVSLPDAASLDEDQRDVPYEDSSLGG
jgi:hypothetical protein